MNEKLQKHLSQIENCIGIQRDCLIPGDSSFPYMHGMLNGLICAHSIIAECSPTYNTAANNPLRYKSETKIRHKRRNGK